MKKETVSISIPHRLTREEARARLQGGFSRLQSEAIGRVVEVKETWSGDHLDFELQAMAQRISGRLEVADKEVRLEIDLPWLLANLAGPIRDRLRRQTTLLLEKK